MELLIRGKTFLVDKEDYERLSKYKWHIINGGYAATHEKGNGKKTLLLHRIILNVPKGKYTDHINGDITDNRKQNLRICTQSENLLNKRNKVISKSGLVGVYKYNDKWGAEVKRNGIKKYLGTFDTPELASNARTAFLRKDVESA